LARSIASSLLKLSSSSPRAFSLVFRVGIQTARQESATGLSTKPAGHRGITNFCGTCSQVRKERAIFPMIGESPLLQWSLLQRFFVFPRRTSNAPGSAASGHRIGPSMMAQLPKLAGNCPGKQNVFFSRAGGAQLAERMELWDACKIANSGKCRSRASLASVSSSTRLLWSRADSVVGCSSPTGCLKHSFT
jgi:hypothetical protein